MGQTDPLDALGDANRRAILAILAHGPVAVGQIADQLPISRPAVSRHLRLLKQAQLVSDRSDGTKRIYALDASGARDVRQYLDDLWGTALPRFRMVAENTTPRGGDE